MPNQHTTSEGRRALARHHAELVAHHARFCIHVDEDGFPQTSTKREGGLNVIAVLGLAEIERRLTETVLVEIGLGSTRPYHSSRPYLNGDGHRTAIPARSHVSIPHEQLARVWPSVNELIHDHATAVVRNWKTRWGFPSGAGVARTHWNGYHEVRTALSWQHMERGPRISFPLDDVPLMGIALQGLARSRRIAGARRFADKCLRGYRNIEYSAAQLKHFASRQGGIGALHASFSERFAPVHYALILHGMQSGRRELFRCVIEELFEVPDEAIEPWERLLKTANGLRLEGCELVLPPAQKRPPTDHFVVELLPR